MTKAEQLLLDKLYKRHGHKCHYCGIEDGDFLDLWGKFYGLPYRGRRLEIDHKDAVVIRNGEITKGKKPELKDTTAEQCVLACALCNMAKSNMFTYEEFKQVGQVIRGIWQQRKDAGLTVKSEAA